MVCGFHPKPFVVLQGRGLRNRTYYKGPVRGGVVLGGGAFDQQRVLCNRVLKFQEPRGVDGVIVFLFFLLLLLFLFLFLFLFLVLVLVLVLLMLMLMLMMLMMMIMVPKAMTMTDHMDFKWCG